MTYDASSLAALVRRSLETRPLIRLSEISRTAHVDRHTLSRAVHSIYSMTFRELRAEILRHRVESLQATDPPRSVKEIAFELGYEVASSLSRRRPGINGQRVRSPLASNSRERPES